MNKHGIQTVYVPEEKRALLERFKKLLFLKTGRKFSKWVLDSVEKALKDLEDKGENIGEHRRN